MYKRLSPDLLVLLAGLIGPGFSWKCNEGSKVPTLPDPPQPGKP